MVVVLLLIVASALALTFSALFGVYYDKHHRCREQLEDVRQRKAYVESVYEVSQRTHEEETQLREEERQRKLPTPQPTMAIAISTFMREASYASRIVHYQRCILSLTVSEFPGTIYIVDDGSEVKHHLDWTRDLGDERLVIVEKPENSGIARTKNTCIRLCLENPEVTYFFLSDDDVIFKTPRWFEIYTNATYHTGIDHLCFAIPDARATASPCQINKYDLITTILSGGCLLTGTRALVERVGYFKVLPHKYGHEHTHYSRRASSGFYDAYDSNHHLALSDGSNDVHAIEFTAQELSANGAEAADISQIYCPCIE